MSEVNSHLREYVTSHVLTAVGDHYTVKVEGRTHPRRGTPMAPLFTVTANDPRTSREFDLTAHWPTWCCSTEDLAASLAGAPKGELTMFCGDVRYRRNSGWRCRDFSLTPVTITT